MDNVQHHDKLVRRHLQALTDATVRVAQNVPSLATIQAALQTTIQNSLGPIENRFGRLETRVDDFEARLDTGWINSKPMWIHNSKYCMLFVRYCML